MAETKVIINQNERIDDLERDGFRIIQRPDKFCFGMDAVLLSSFAKVAPGEIVLDMCSGNGVIPILMYARNKDAKFVGLEIQEDISDMASRSILLNGIENHVSMTCGDVKIASKIFGSGVYDAVTVNPPYMNENHGLVNPSDAKAIARHEILCTLEDVVRESSAVLKSGGKFFMVHRPSRLVEIFEVMRKYKIEPKRIRMVHPHVEDEAKMVLIEGAKGGGSFLKSERPLIIYDADGNYTREVYEIYEN